MCSVESVGWDARRTVRFHVQDLSGQALTQRSPRWPLQHGPHRGGRPTTARLGRGARSVPRRREPHRPPAVLQRAPPPHTPRRPANLRRRGADKSPLTAAAARTPSLPLVAPPAAARGEEPIRDRCCCLGCRRLSRTRTPLATLYAAPTTLGGLWFTRPVQGVQPQRAMCSALRGPQPQGQRGPPRRLGRASALLPRVGCERAPQSHIMGGVNNTPKIRPLAFWLLSGHHTPPHVCFDRPMAQ